MLILHPKTGDIVAEIIGSTLTLYSDILSDALRLNGIVIPISLRGQYGYKKILYPGDELFAQAFVEIYYPSSLREAGFILKEKN